MTVAKVVTRSTAAPPLKDTFGAVRSPEAEKFRAVSRVVAVLVLPVKAPTKEVEVIEVAPVTIPASTIIVPSRTIVDPDTGVILRLPLVEDKTLPLRFRLSTCNAVRVPREVTLA